MENVACGGDMGVFSHDKNELELILMRRPVRRGIASLVGRLMVGGSA